MDANLESFIKAVSMAMDAAPAKPNAGTGATSQAVGSGENKDECHAEDPNNCRFHHTGIYAQKNTEGESSSGGASHASGGESDGSAGAGAAQKKENLSDGTPCALNKEGAAAKAALEKAIAEVKDPELKAKLEAVQKEAEAKIKALMGGSATNPDGGSHEQGGAAEEPPAQKKGIPQDKQSRLDYVQSLYDEEIESLDAQLAEGKITKKQHYGAVVKAEEDLEQAKAAIEKKFAGAQTAPEGRGSEGHEAKENTGGGENGEGTSGGKQEPTFSGISSDEQKNECAERADKINAAMAAAGMNTSVSEVRANPFFTQYVFQHDGAVSAKELKELKAKYGPGIGKLDLLGPDMFAVTVQNDKVADVSFSDVTSEGEVAERAEKMTAPCVLGRGIDGAPVVKDLSAMKHLLVGGKSGEGKSSVINSVLTGMMKFKSPEDLELYLVDPQRAEFEPYGDMPHTKAYVGGMDGDNPAKVAAMLDGCIQEMEHRTEFFAKLGVKNLEAYRAFAAAHPDKNLPKIPARIIGIDEFPMLIGDKEHGSAIASKVKRLAAEARKAGIHLIVAAQDPKLTSVGDIKANMSKVAVKTETSQASRNILDQNGAEELTGRGDMYIKTDKGLERSKGAFIDDKEGPDGKSMLKTELEGIRAKWGDAKPASPAAPAATSSHTPESPSSPSPSAPESSSTASSAAPSATQSEIDVEIGKILDQAQANGGQISPEDSTRLEKLQNAKRFGLTSLVNGETGLSGETSSEHSYPNTNQPVDISHLGFFAAMKKAFTEGLKGRKTTYNPAARHSEMAAEWRRSAERNGGRASAESHPLHRIIGPLPPHATQRQQAMAEMYRKKMDDAIAKENPTLIRSVQKQYLSWLEDEGLAQSTKVSAPNPYMKFVE